MRSPVVKLLDNADTVAAIMAIVTKETSNSCAMCVGLGEPRYVLTRGAGGDGCNLRVVRLLKPLSRLEVPLRTLSHQKLSHIQCASFFEELFEGRP